MTTREVAAAFGVGETTVRRWGDSGLLPYFRTPGGMRRYVAAEVAKLLDRELLHR